MKSAAVSRPWIELLLELANNRSFQHNLVFKSDSLFRDLDSCFHYCNKVTAYHSKSFFLASSLLPKEKRNAIRALYAFCRTTDDIIDMDHNNKSVQIERCVTTST